MLKQASHYCQAGTVRMKVTYFGWSQAQMHMQFYAGCYAGGPAHMHKMGSMWRSILRTVWWGDRGILPCQICAPAQDNVIPAGTHNPTPPSLTHRMELWHSHSSWMADKIGTVAPKEENRIGCLCIFPTIGKCQTCTSWGHSQRKNLWVNLPVKCFVVEMVTPLDVKPCR